MFEFCDTLSLVYIPSHFMAGQERFPLISFTIHFILLCRPSIPCKTIFIIVVGCMNRRILMECCSASLLPILHTRFHKSFVGTSLEQRLLHSFMRLSSRDGTLLSTAAGLEPPTCQTQPQNGEIYTTLQHKVSSELEVKRSKFIAVAAPIYDEEGARAFLSEVRDPRATHNCWAYKLGEQYRFNDDGEPGGTAGRPIHSAIVSSGLDRVMAVVIRYFGGIKLGTGGLVRAYGGVTSECLKDAPTCVVKSKVTMILGVPFDLLGSIYPLLQSHQVGNLKHEYDVVGDGINRIKFAVDFDKVDTLEQLIKNSCHARVTISRI